MSSLGPGDRDLHYHDGSHRWAGGPQGMDLPAWHAIIRAHMQQHLAGMGGSTTDTDEVEAHESAAKVTHSTLVERRTTRWIARRRTIERANQNR